MSESWGDYADDWDSNPDAVRYAELAFDSLCLSNNPTGLHVLDFGCGTGLLTQKIAAIASSVVAVDSSRKMIDVLKAKNLNNVSTFMGEVSESSINAHAMFTSGFDLIVASSVCLFLPDVEKTLVALKSLSVPGGFFIQWDWESTDSKAKGGLTDAFIKNTYVKAGFSVVDVSTAFSLATDKGSMPVLMGVARNA